MSETLGKKPILLLSEGRDRAELLATAMAGHLGGTVAQSPRGTRIRMDRVSFTLPSHGPAQLNCHVAVDEIGFTLTQVDGREVDERRFIVLDYFDFEAGLDAAARRLADYIPEAVACAVGPWDAVIPEPWASGSTNDFTGALPARRHWHECKGLVLFLPMTRTTVVPYELTKGGANCVVVGAEDGQNRPGGHNLHVGEGELRTAVERPMAPASR